MLRTALEEDAWREGIEVLSGLPNWITLRVSSRLVTAERLIHFMTRVPHDVDNAERDTLMLAFREVLMNAMEHGAGFNPEQAVGGVGGPDAPRHRVLHPRSGAGSAGRT